MLKHSSVSPQEEGTSQRGMKITDPDGVPYLLVNKSSQVNEEVWAGYHLQVIRVVLPTFQISRRFHFVISQNISPLVNSKYKFPKRTINLLYK